MRFALTLCFSVLWSTSLLAQDYLNFGVTYGDEKQEFRGRLPSGASAVHFSLTGEHAGYSFTYGQSRFFVFGGRAYDLEWIADISPTSRHGDGDVPSYLTANGFSSRAKTSRLGLGLRRVFANTDFARLSSAVELGLSHTSLRINYLGVSIHGSDTSAYAAISLRADTVYDRKNRL